MQCHHIRNLSNKNYIFHGFLSAQQQKLRVIIFGSVRFLSKKVTNRIFKKKTETEPKPVQTGLARVFWFSRFWLSFFQFWLGFFWCGSVFFGQNQFKPVWLGFSSLARFSRFWLGFFRFWLSFFLCGSVILVWLGFDLVFFRFFSVSVRFFGFFLIKPKPNRTGRFFQNFNQFFFRFGFFGYFFFLVFSV